VGWLISSGNKYELDIGLNLVTGLTMNPQDYYFNLTPCDNGWLIKQYEWVKQERYDATASFVFDNIVEAMEKLEELAGNPVSFVKSYE